MPVFDAPNDTQRVPGSYVDSICSLCITLIIHDPEELIRRVSEQSSETAGEHFTPREVVRLMVDLLFIEDDARRRDPYNSSRHTVDGDTPRSI